MLGYLLARAGETRIWAATKLKFIVFAHLASRCYTFLEKGDILYVSNPTYAKGTDFGTQESKTEARPQARWQSSHGRG
jgi:hypothetical protein